MPVILTIMMWTVFVNLTVYFGLVKGYLFSFIIYWVFWCFFFPLFILGDLKAMLSLFKSVSPLFGNKPDLTLFLLSWPIVLVLFYGFIPQFHNLTVPTFALSVLLGFINGTAEEILWRGTYVRTFPGKIWLNHICPSIGFALWHVCPISVMTTRYSGDVYSFLGVSLLLGLSWGYK